MVNTRIARIFDEVAALLAAQGASPYRVRAWHEAAATIAGLPRELADVFRDHGRAGLEALPHIGRHLAAVIIELLRSGHAAILDRLRGEGHHADPSLPIAVEPPAPAHHGPTLPPVALVLATDARYRAAADANQLPRIAPRRNNPDGATWLPVLHDERDGWVWTALYSNTARAHELGHTHDWVVVYYHHPDEGDEGHATVVTEHRGPWRGHRVVRGREGECAIHALALGLEPRP